MKTVRLELVFAAKQGNPPRVVYVDFDSPGYIAAVGYEGFVVRSRLVGADPENHWVDVQLSDNYVALSTMLTNISVTATVGTYSHQISWDTLAEWLNPGLAPEEELQHKPFISGATCKRCNEYNQYAEAVRDFICYGCR